MSRQSSLTVLYLTLGTILFNVLSTTSAATIPKSSIIEATKQKHDILINFDDKDTKNDHLRQLQYSNNPPLTTEQFDQCKSDLILADINSNQQLDKYEYLRFLSLNSAHYDYAWGFASNQISLGDLPLEFSMLFHSTACMCAYEQVSGVDFGCCEGDNGHVIVYAEKDDGGIFSSMTEEEEAYTRLFCTEAYYSYSATFMPTRSPIVPPIVTLPPTEEAVVTKSPTGSPTNGQVVETMPPTFIEPVRLPTASPVSPGEGGTNSPTISPNTMPITPSPMATDTTSSPTNSNSPISTDATLSPTSSPITTTTTLSPTISPSSLVNPPTQSPISSILSIDIQYGISSNCGMTAEDVLNNNYGITIQDGLISATEIVVVDILNTTFPRAEEEIISVEEEEISVEEEETETATIPPTVISEESDGSGGVNTEPTLSPTGGVTSVPEEGLTFEGPSDPPTTMANDPFLPPSPSTPDDVPSRLDDEEMMKEDSVENDPFMPSLKGVRFRVFGPLHKSNRRNLVQLDVASSPQHKYTTSNHHQDSRSLVYYTQLNPIVITDIEDVFDQACPEGINCMRVLSTIYVTLEEGDDPAVVEQVLLDGFQSSLQDASFFQVSVLYIVG